MVSSSRDSYAIATSLCKIVKNPEGFNGKMVRVRATVLTNFEISLLIDQSCEPSLGSLTATGNSRRRQRLMSLQNYVA